MKNKLKLIIIILFLTFLNFKNLLSDEFQFEASEIQVLSNGNIIKATNGVKIISNNNIEIFADEFTYNKTKYLLKAKGNVKFLDTANKINIKTDKIFYLKKQEKIYSKSITNAIFEDKYYVTTKGFTYLKDKKEFISKKKTNLKDNFGNTFLFKKLKFNLKNKIIRADKINYSDNQLNKYYIENAMIDLNSNEIIGKDINIDFNRSTFNNSLNEPRLKANKVYANKNLTTVSKGAFTTCKKRDGCPPWVISAEEIKHDKIQKKLIYKNAWLQVYDKPILYFPKFSHPDPSVKRQSGFLVPNIFDSSNLGLAVAIPYYKVISDNKDLTFKPRFYTNENIILQSEYRQVNKSNSHIVDFSLNADGGIHNKNSSKTHFFSKSRFDLNVNRFDSSNIELKIKRSSNDTYLKTYKINSSLIEDYSTLDSNLIFTAESENLLINASIEMYEDKTKPRNDRFEYVYPNFNITKFLEFNDNNLSLQTQGYQKHYNTNVYEAVVINDLLVESGQIFTQKGFKNNFKYLIKNVNTDAENSTIYKPNTEHELLSIFLFETSYPLKKLGNNYDNFLTPILSMRFSPNKTKNIISDDRRIDINNVYSLNRIGKADTLEGGESITVGGEYKKVDKNNNEFLTLNLAQVMRFNENEDLPLKSTIGSKSSDIVGNFKLKPNKYLDFNYDFSLDNDLKRSNYDLIKTKLTINNFVTSFEFLEEKNAIGREGYINNNTKYAFNENNSLSFGTRRNKKTDLTEFYNLIYEYKNDCLVASVKYNKEYYSDSDLKPEEQLFFSLTIMPFGKINSMNLNQ